MSPSMEILFPKLDTALTMFWERRVGLGGLQRSLPAPAGPWLCGTNTVKVMQISQPRPFPHVVWELSTEVCACDKIFYVFYRKEYVIRPMTQEKDYLLTSGRACALMRTQRFTELGKFQVLPTEQHKWPVGGAFCFVFFPHLHYWGWLCLSLDRFTGKRIRSSESGPQ